MSDQQLDGAGVMRQFIPSSPYVGHLGMELVSIGDGEAEIVLPFREQVVTLGTTVHGGAIASLIDTTAMAAAWAGAEVPENLRGTTVGLTVSYLNAANKVDLRARARVLRRGRSLSYIDVDVLDPDGNAVAKGLVTYKIG